MIHTAVIMAAGLGSRFGIYTQDRPKGFIEVGGESMIGRSVRTLIACGIDKIYIGTGYMKEAFEQLKTQYPQIECCFSPRYAETNSMYTLYNMRSLIHEDFLLLESDIIFEQKAISVLIHDEHADIMLTTPVVKFQDQYYVEFDEAHHLTNCSIDKTMVHTNSELVGIHKLSKVYYDILVNEYVKLLEEKPKLGYEFMLLDIAQRLRPMYVLDVPGLLWYEIDDTSDKQYAETYVLTKII